MPVTNGLIRWWPNMFDVRDEITGQEGVVMGLLDPVVTGAPDETEFNRKNGFVLLQPAITNEVFTLVFWVRQEGHRCRLVGQQSDSAEWFFQSVFAEQKFFIGPYRHEDSDRLENVELTMGTWRHVGIARRADGTSVAWLNGVRALEGKRPHPWPSDARWLTVGSGLERGEEDLVGQVRDLCAFDRVLDDAEMRLFQAAGLSARPARNTAARLAALAASVPTESSTNVLRSVASDWIPQRFTIENGLPGTIVKAVLQTSKGYLWVGTQDGLARFDGRQFRVFTADNTPALKAIGQTIWSLAEDTDGTIWAGVFGGLLRIRGQEFTAFTNGLPRRFVLQAQPAGDGSVWLASFSTSIPREPLWLRHYYPEAGQSSGATAVPGHVRRICVATNGVWLAAEGPQTILFWNGSSPAPTVVGMINPYQPEVRLGSSALPPASQLHHWSILDKVPIHWSEIRLGDSGPRFSWVWPAPSPAWTAHPGRWAGPADDSQLWLGVHNDLARLRGTVLETIPLSEFSKESGIVCLCANREGGIWYGTEEDGLNFLQERLIRVYTTADGLAGNDVRALAQTPQGELFVASSHGLSRWESGRWTSYSCGSLSGVASDSMGRAWFGQEGRAAWIATHSNDAIAGHVLLNIQWQDPNTLLFARDGTLWITDELGLTWINPERLSVEPEHRLIPDRAQSKPAFNRYAIGHDLPKMFPLGLVEDGDGSIWMGSLANGLFHFTGGHIEMFGRKEGLPSDSCVPVYRDSSGALWLVTGNSLTRRRDGRFQTIGEKDGLPKDVFLDLIADDLGNFWISGKRGIHRVARRELEQFFLGHLSSVQALTLGGRDGLLTPECSSLHHPTMAKTPDGHIWVATRNGLATFDPARVRLNTKPLPAIIEQLTVNRREVPLKTLGAVGQTRFDRSPALRLPPGSGQQLEFQFTAVSLLGADRLRFRHRLKGYDDAWSPETDLRLAFYTNLRPRAYRFQVKASNAHGIWNEEPTSLSFVILPFFWQTAAFKAALVAGLAGLAALLHWRKLQKSRWQAELRHAEALASEKARIAADMHDELGAALTQISILGEVAKSQAPADAPTRFTLARISDAAREATARMSDLVWATNPRNDSLDNLVACLRANAAAQLESACIQSDLNFPAVVEERKVSATFRRNLLLVLKEGLHNALKHAQATRVTVEVQVTEGVFHLHIADNGRGFQQTLPTACNHGNGLGNMERRVRDLGGCFELRSAPGAGVRIGCRVPIQ